MLYSGQSPYQGLRRILWIVDSSEQRLHQMRLTGNSECRVQNKILDARACSRERRWRGRYESILCICQKRIPVLKDCVEWYYKPIRLGMKKKTFSSFS